MELKFLISYSLTLLLVVTTGNQLSNLVYVSAETNNVANSTNIDAEINNLLNKIGRGNIIDSTINSLMQGMGSSNLQNPSSSSLPSSSSSSSSASSLQSLLPPSTSSLPSSSSSSSSASSLQSLLPPSTSSSPDISSTVNSEILSIYKNQDFNDQSLSINQKKNNDMKYFAKNNDMKYFAKIMNKNSDNENIIRSNSWEGFSNNLLEFCLKSSIDYYICSSSIQDSLRVAQFTSSYSGPARVNTDLTDYKLELKIK